MVEKVAKLAVPLSGTVTAEVPGETLSRSFSDGDSSASFSIQVPARSASASYSIPAGTEVLVEIADEPPGEEPPPPLPVREPMTPQTITGKQGLVIKDRIITGGAGLKLVGCRDVTIENVEILKSSYSGLWLDGCINVIVRKSFFHDNGRYQDGSNSARLGHGIHIGGNTSANILIEDCTMQANFEDGVQQANSVNPFDTPTYRRCEFIDNMENGFDGKAGKAYFVDCTFVNNGDGRGMEGLILHNTFGGCVLEDCFIAVKANETGGSGLNTGSGPAKLVRCRVTAEGSASIPVESSGPKLEVIDSTLISNATKPLVRLSNGAHGLLERVELFKPTNLGWIMDNGTSFGSAQAVPGLRTPTFEIR